MNKIDSVRVRMYRHGFGDCFLLRFFAGGDTVCSMLIDCGLKKNDSVEGITLEDVRDDIVRNIKKRGEDEKPHLDILVVTHEHWDHVSGFHPDRRLFDAFSVGQVWMAWTEDPGDEDAKVLNKGLQERVKALQLAADKLKEHTETSRSFFMNIVGGDRQLAARESFHTSLESVMEFLGPFTLTKTPGGISVKDNFTISLETQKAMDHIRTLADNTDTGIRYCSPGDLIDLVDKLPGIRIYVLGPPRNKLLNKDKPSSGANKEVYFGDGSLAGFVDGILGMEDGNTVDSSRPFGKVSSLPEKEGPDQPYLTRKGGYYDPDCKWRTIEEDWLNMAGGLAMQMDSDTNNTSLALAIEFKDSNKVLLFPGDAQVGNWLSWHDHTWTIQKNGTSQEINAIQLLNNTVFYKVGHHSSHNATLKEKGLELMTHEALVAFVPEKEKQYSGIPYMPLIEVLKKKTKGRLIVSADKTLPANTALTTKPPALDAAEWEAFKTAIELKDLYVEYTLKG